MTSSNKVDSNKKVKWQEYLGTALKVAEFVVAVVAVVNGVDTYVHHHPHGLNNHKDWKG